MSTPRRSEPFRVSPLDDVHRASKAIFTDFAGWRLPLRFSGDLAEHRAVRDSAGLFDISHMGQLSVEGEEAASSLAVATVSDVRALDIGAACYTMLCQGDGGVIDDVIVYRLDSDELLVIANASNTEAVLASLTDLSATAGVSIEDRTDERALVSLQGPNAAKITTACLDGDGELPRRFGIKQSSIAGRHVLLARTGYTGEDGFEISVRAGDAEPVWNRLLEGDGSSEVLPAGLAARDSLRLEAGLPLYGHELSLRRTPFSAGYGRVVDFDHDFPGRAALSEVARRGPEEVLIGLVCGGHRSPRAGYAVKAGDGRTIGVVTSGGPSPTLGVPIAMAYVARGDAEVGLRVSIDVRDRPEPATVVSLPFYRRHRRETAPTAPRSSGAEVPVR